MKAASQLLGVVAAVEGRQGVSACGEGARIIRADGDLSRREEAVGEDGIGAAGSRFLSQQTAAVVGVVSVAEQFASKCAAGERGVDGR